jgi:alpha-mannosidase
MTKPTLHLVCNAHLDPAWQWDWQSGAAEALSTFRTAADLCEEFPDFIFCHNEALLYQWVEEFEPALFARIRKLVAAGRWHIMGGWYLQPDCNMPSGESIVRQILLGKTYFKEKFGVEVTTAMNVDSFGHSRGLVQILARSGYDSYLIGRPKSSRGQAFDGEEFVWQGFDGSEVLVKRVRRGYGTRVDAAMPSLGEWLKTQPPFGCEGFFWGVGDHGGGASRKDLQELEQFITSRSDIEIRHSTPQALFNELAKGRAGLPRFANELNPEFPGCYTSMVRLKQKHRRLENELFSLEKMAAAATTQRLQAWPVAAIDEALRALLLSQFHDMLPGSGIQDVEEHTLQLLDHGLELMGREKLRSFFALCAGQEPAAAGNPPILVYNPHPYPVDDLVECEFHLHDFNWRGTFFDAELFTQGNRQLPHQIERERANASLDWGKRLVFAARLAPGMNRFDTRLTELPAKPAGQLRAVKGVIHFQGADLEARISTRTGLLESLRIGGSDVLGRHAFQPLVLADYVDPWGLVGERRSGETVGRFTLLSTEAATASAAVPGPLPPVRVIEDGPVRTVIEVVMGYEASRLVLQYKLPKRGTEFEVALRVLWHEPLKMLKLVVPFAPKLERALGQTIFGVQECPANGEEVVTQKWQALVSDAQDLAVSCIDDGLYGSDFGGNALRLTLLRSPAYSNLGAEIAVRDRHNPVIDLGERQFRFWFNAGPVAERLARIETEALVKNERPYALSFFPPGTGVAPHPLARLADPRLQLVAAKRAQQGEELIVRLFNPTAERLASQIEFPWLPATVPVALAPFALLTLRVAPDGEVMETDLLETRRIE